MFEVRSVADVHVNPWFTVAQAEVVDALGSSHAYFFVRKRDSVLTVARSSDGRVALLSTIRPTFPRVTTIEFPQGGIEPTEDPSDAARRELEEETGLQVSDIARVGTLQEASGFA